MFDVKRCQWYPRCALRLGGAYTQQLLLHFYNICYRYIVLILYRTQRRFGHTQSQFLHNLPNLFYGFRQAKLEEFRAYDSNILMAKHGGCNRSGGSFRAVDLASLALAMARVDDQ